MAKGIEGPDIGLAELVFDAALTNLSRTPAAARTYLAD
jgi:hypothetical protein